MKALLSILLSTLVLVCATSKAWVYLAFKLNQSYIAAELCKNRYEALVLCSGACYLDKQLEALDDKEQQSKAVPNVEGKDFHFPSIIGLDEALSAIDTNHVHFSSVKWLSSTYTPWLLKPPQHSILV